MTDKDEGPRPTNQPPKAQGRPPVARMRPCDAPGLNPLGFFLAIMHDASMPMHTRIEAASKALPYTLRPPLPPESIFVEREPWPGEARITIQIIGLPTEAKDPEPQNTDHGPGQVGHA